MNFFLNSHSKIASERGIIDLGNDLLRSAAELQFRLLNSPLDLIEGSDVRGLLYPSLDLAMLNSHLKMR